MELKKSNQAAGDLWYEDVAPVAPLAEITNQINTSTLDVDLDDTWELKSKLRCVRDERGPLNALRWLLWERYGSATRPRGSKHGRIVADFPVMNIAPTRQRPPTL